MQHAANVSAWRMRLTRLVLHFKLDEADRLCLLWCSSLRTSPGIEPALEGWLRSAKGAAASRAPPPAFPPPRSPASPQPRFPPGLPPPASGPLTHARPSLRGLVAWARLQQHRASRTLAFTAELSPAELPLAELGRRGLMRRLHRNPPQS